MKREDSYREFQLQALEPRILLSADVVGFTHCEARSSLDSAAIEIHSEMGNAPASPDEHGFGLMFDGAEELALAQEESMVSPGTDLDGTSAVPLPEAATDLALAMAQPDLLPALHEVCDDPSALKGQVIFLNFKGAAAVIYDGPVRVENVEVPAFQLPSGRMGDANAIIHGTLDSLNKQFALLGVTFTTGPPEPSGEYSTIHVGGDGSAFEAYGSFLGLAEKVDVGNQDRSDRAFVFSEKVLAACRTYVHVLNPTLYDSI
ncbi:MAG: LEPR-XLL domain-containing protein [Pedosphaera sp.]|nr:LEPR-XLL domain-containing protein [Pedosphaera sp.]